MSKTFGTGGPRTLSPDCCASEKLAACSLGAQLLFDRLLVVADDQGRLRGDTVALKAACFPLCTTATLSQLERWKTELATSGLTKVYPAGSAIVVQIVRWWEYQAGMRRAYPSRFPAPRGWSDRVYGIPADERPGTVARKARAVRGQSADAMTAPAGAGAGASARASARADAGEVPAPAVAGASAETAKEGLPGNSATARKPLKASPASEFAAWFVERYRETQGSPYVMTVKDGVTVARLLKTFSADELRARAERLLATTDPWLARTDHGLGVLATQINRPELRGITPTEPAHDISRGSAPISHTREWHNGPVAL